MIETRSLTSLPLLGFREVRGANHQTEVGQVSQEYGPRIYMRWRQSMLEIKPRKLPRRPCARYTCKRGATAAWYASLFR